MLHAGRGNPEWIIFLDPPRHAKLRGLISKAFTPTAIANLEPRISRTLLNNMASRTEIDLVSEYATPLPMMVIAQMIGMSTGELDNFQRWSDGILKLSYTVFAGAAAAEAFAEYSAAKTQLTEYLGKLIDRQLIRLLILGRRHGQCRHQHQYQRDRLQQFHRDPPELRRLFDIPLQRTQPDCALFL